MSLDINLNLNFQDWCVDRFVRFFIFSKDKPSKALIESCYPLLEIVSPTMFQSLLLPYLLKILLRSPEIIIECVGLVLGGLKIDLTTCAFEIGKSLIGACTEFYIIVI